MTKEDKELLLKDLSARLPYKVKVQIRIPNYQKKEFESLVGDLINLSVYGGYTVESKGIDYHHPVDLDIKPYLRPMSSMTEEEGKELEHLFCEIDAPCWVDTEYGCVNFAGGDFIDTEIAEVYIDWLNAHHFDYRGLIEKGLAIKAPEGIYNLEKK